MIKVFIDFHTFFVWICVIIGLRFYVSIGPILSLHKIDHRSNGSMKIVYNMANPQ